MINDTKVYQEPSTPFQLQYPPRWTNAESLQEVLLKVEDPTAVSAYKTSLTVEARDLDPTAPPTMQQLIDRRVEQRSQLTAYHFISNTETSVDGAPAQELRYTYVVQPNDTPRRVSLPVVIIARDYIILTPERSYYLTLAAPENELTRQSAYGSDPKVGKLTMSKKEKKTKSKSETKSKATKKQADRNHRPRRCAYARNGRFGSSHSGGR